jgi:hypothetical protein
MEFHRRARRLPKRQWLVSSGQIKPISNRSRARCLCSIALAAAGMLAFLAVAVRQHNEGVTPFAAFWVVPGLASLCLALRSISRNAYGPAAAWEACALPLIAMDALLSLALTLTPGATGPVVQPAYTAYWVPSAFFLGCFVLILACIRSTRAARRQ